VSGGGAAEDQSTYGVDYVDVDSGETLSRVGARIKELRRGKHLTLQSVADSTGLSASMVSLVERGKASPSLGALMRICSALDVQMSSLFDFSSDVSRDAVIRRDDHPIVHTSEGVTRRIIRSDPIRGDEFVVNEFEPGSASDTNKKPHAGHEYGLVLKGKLIIELGGVSHELRSGDSIAFDSTVPHRFINKGRSNAVAVWFNARR
jgi:transcriptional regulator with XRE-family HTH domain